MNDNNKENTIPNNNEEQKRNKSNTFNLIIGIATLLIALLGATFAYFSATARSRENDVSVKSAYVSISYDGGTDIKASHLIPATVTVAMEKYKKEIAAKAEDEEVIDEDEYKTTNTDRRCVDANGREVCYVYQFTINSEGEEGRKTDIVGAIKINDNTQSTGETPDVRQFENLSYAVFRVETRKVNGERIIDKYGNTKVYSYEYLENNFENMEDPEKYPDNINYRNFKFAKFEKRFETYDSNGAVNRTVFPLACLFGYSDDYDNVEADDIKRCATYPINNNEEYTFQVVIWLEETGEVQDEQGIAFNGTVQLEVPTDQNAGGEYSDGKITGKE